MYIQRIEQLLRLGKKRVMAVIGTGGGEEAYDVLSL